MTTTQPGTMPVPWQDDDEELAWLTEMEATDPEALAAHAQSAAMQANTMCFANRGLRALARVERDLAALKEATRRDVDAVVARWEARCVPLVARAEYLRQGLRSLWTAGALQPSAGKKSVALEAGTVGTRHHGPKVVVTDEKLLAADPGASGCFLKVVVRKLDKKGLDEYVLTTGDVPPGVEVVPEGDDVYVKAEPVEYPAHG
jgi:hypothetical protein